MSIPRCMQVFLILFVAGCGPTPPTSSDVGTIAAESAQLNGSGATFVEPIMKFWTEEFLHQTNDKIRINYQGTGSGAGIAQYTQKLTDFGCSDAPLNQKQLTEANSVGGTIIHIPLVIGAVVPMYNLEGVNRPIVFSGPLLAEIFTGKVTKWNDPKLKALNPGLSLPDQEISPVVRSDASGTTFVFTDYLSKVSPEFKRTIGASTAPKWPSSVGTAQNKSDGVAGHIARTSGSIGYIELTYALDKKATYGSVVNKEGKAVLADLDSITAAASASLSLKQTDEPYSLHELTYSLTDASGEKSYPIAATSFAVIFEKQSGAKGKAVVQFLKWCTSPVGQEMAKKRNFAPLPAELQAKIAARLDRIQVTR